MRRREAVTVTESRARGLLSPQLVAIGAIGGVLSGLLGVGGGIVMVPLLTLWAGYTQRISHAMSLAAIIPISVGGIATYGGAGKIDFVHAASLTVGSVIGARSGARMLARADERTLKVAFGVFLTLVAIAMAVRP
jgi:uncharacterized membrane protein YfcA